MKVKYSRSRHNAKQTSFTSPTGARRQCGEQEHAQYCTNHAVTSRWSCRRPENVSILSSLFTQRNENRAWSQVTFMWPLVRQLGFLSLYVCTLFVQLHMWYVISKLKSKQGLTNTINNTRSYFLIHHNWNYYPRRLNFRGIKKHPCNSRWTLLQFKRNWLY